MTLGPLCFLHGIVKSLVLTIRRGTDCRPDDSCDAFRGPLRQILDALGARMPVDSVPGETIARDMLFLLRTRDRPLAANVKRFIVSSRSDDR